MKRLSRLASMLTRPKPPVGSTPADVIHRENKWRLLRYRPRAGGPAFATPVLLVPSLINRHYVMDLLPGKSMAEDLVKAGVIDPTPTVAMVGLIEKEADITTQFFKAAGDVIILIGKLGDDGA